MHEPLCKQVRHPLEPHPHDVDVNALLCIAVVYNIPIACNRSAADFLLSYLSSPLMHSPYDRRIRPLQRLIAGAA